MELGEKANEYRSLLTAVALKRCNNLETAEDLVQLTILKAIRAGDKFRGECSLKNWLLTILRNVCNNYHRAKKDMENIDDIELAAEEPPPPPDDRQIQLRKEIEKLPNKQRQAVILRVYNGLSFKEIAKIMNAPYDTAKANYRHGILAVKCRIRNEQ